MGSATFVRDRVGGHSGPGRVWHLDPPAQIGGQAHEHVCIWISPASQYQAAEAVVVASTESGAAVGGSVIRRAGSFVLHADYDGQPEYVDGAHLFALMMLGYTVAAQRPQDD
ncbi:hypothetical protein [Nocardia sp. NPDC051463]|uniref:hypothetical protein n=1 Tax=Nocardia sp. NPDC051463 TaxID=3154845 RepID=UPI00344B3267